MSEKETLFYTTSDQIRTNPENSWENGDLTDLIASVRSFGIIEPLALMGPMKDGTYQLLSGERRYKSILRIEEADNVKIHIPCYLKGDCTLSKEMQRIYINAANLETREPDMRAKNSHRAAIMEDLLEIQKSQHFSDRSIAAKASELFRCSPTYARFWKLVFTSGTESLKDLLKENGVSAKNASRISTLTPEQQEAVVDRIREVNEQNDNNGRSELKQGKSSVSVSTIIEDVKKDHPVPEMNPDENNEPDTVPSVKEHETPAPSKSSSLKLSDKDLEMLDIDPEEIDVDALIGEGYDQEAEYDYSSPVQHVPARNVDTAAAAVTEWCRAIIKKEDLTDEEWEAVDACKEVADVFA